MQTDRDIFNVVCYYPFNDMLLIFTKNSIILIFIHENIKIYE